MSQQVQLEIRKRSELEWRSPERPQTHITRALPFYKSNNGNAKFYHRVRSGTAYWNKGKIRHIAFTFYCGNGGIVLDEKRSDLYEEIPEGGVLCPTCELKIRTLCQT